LERDALGDWVGGEICDDELLRLVVVVLVVGLLVVGLLVVVCDDAAGIANTAAQVAATPAAPAASQAVTTRAR
jgi:hypothetical protein